MATSTCWKRTIGCPVSAFGDGGLKLFSADYKLRHQEKPETVAGWRPKNHQVNGLLLIRRIYNREWNITYCCVCQGRRRNNIIGGGNFPCWCAEWLCDREWTWVPDNGWLALDCVRFGPGWPDQFIGIYLITSENFFGRVILVRSELKGVLLYLWSSTKKRLLWAVNSDLILSTFRFAAYRV